jgi:riboflavin kinase / FMN adenylyltransferase
MHVFDGHRALPGRLEAPAVAIGNFDGVHLGHQALLAAANVAALRLQGTSVALTFDPHPSTLLFPEHAPAQITTRARKLELLADCGLGATVVEPFTPELASWGPDQFVDEVLVRALGARHVVVGYDFRYGAGRGGDADSLRAHGLRAGFTVEVVAPVAVDGEKASSSRVRNHLQAGDLAGARRLLGHRYDLDGVVVHGAKRGRAIGIPTANIRPDGELVIAPGIYACRLDRRPAVASLGTNPTFVDQGGLVLEVHVLDFEGDLYDQHVRVEFVAHLRPEAKFDSVDALLAQIHADISAARKCLADDQR